MTLSTLSMDILYEIALFVIPYQYRLREGIPEKKICKNSLCEHPRALHYLFTHHDLTYKKYQPIKWWISDNICKNNNDDAIFFILQSSYKNSVLLYSNPHPQIVSMLSKKDNIEWMYACMNSNDIMVDLILTKLENNWHPEKWEWWSTWNRLSENRNERIVDLFLSHCDQLDLFIPKLFSHPSERLTEYLLTHHSEQIIWSELSKNTSNTACFYLINHPSNVNWVVASSNPNDMLLDYILEHIHIHIDGLSSNPNPRVFEFLFSSYREYINWTNVSCSNNPALFTLLEKETKQVSKEWANGLFKKPKCT